MEKEDKWDWQLYASPGPCSDRQKERNKGFGHVFLGFFFYLQYYILYPLFRMCPFVTSIVLRFRAGFLVLVSFCNFLNPIKSSILRRSLFFTLSLLSASRTNVRERRPVLFRWRRGGEENKLKKKQGRKQEFSNVETKTKK